MKKSKVALAFGLYFFLMLHTAHSLALEYRDLVQQGVREYQHLMATNSSSPTQKNMGTNSWNFCGGGFSLNGTLGSYHSGSRGKNFNEKNLGFGLRCHLNEIAHVEGNIIPRNSMRGFTATVGPGVAWKLYEDGPFYFSAGGTIQAGIYENPVREKFRMIFVGGPTFALGFRQTSVGMFIIPKKDPIYVFGINHKFD